MEQKALEELKEYTNAKNRFMRHTGIVIKEVTPKQTLAELTLGPESLNPAGHLHGGALFTLADAAGGTMARVDGRQYVTESADIHYLRGVDHGTVTATATVIRRGRRSCVVRVDLTGEDGALAATLTGHFTCVAEHYQG